MEERPPICRIAANIFNKQSRTAERGWSSNLRVGRGADKSSPQKRSMLRIVRRESFGHGLILWLANAIATENTGTASTKIFYFPSTPAYNIIVFILFQFISTRN